MSTKQSKTAHRARRPLRLETFEDRLAPATFYVNTPLDDVTPNNGKFSLREAINKANLTAAADMIVLPAGEYMIEIDGLGENANVSGDFDITKPVTIVGKGAGLTKIDAENRDRVFHVIGAADTPINVNFRGLTIARGNQVYDGGGILLDYANVSLRGCVVTRNTAGGYGGGVAGFNGSSLTMIGTTVDHNWANAGDGGGIWLGEKVTAWSSIITGNTSYESGGGISAGTVNLTDCKVNWNESILRGGGINATAAVTLTRTAVTDNRAGMAGGGVYSGGGVTLTRTTVARNVARDAGGGVRAEGEVWANGCSIHLNLAGGGVSGGGGGISATKAIVLNSTISGNYSGSSGGGILATNVDIKNSSVSGNTASSGGGGGIRALESATLDRSTVSGNRAINIGASGAGGGIYAGSATLAKCTVSDNTAHEGGGGIRADFVAILTDCTVSRNAADWEGGGINATTALLVNTTVSGNRAGGAGGGIRAFGPVSLVHVTVTENIAVAGCGVYHDPAGTDSISVKNSIIARNLAYYFMSIPDVSGEFTSLGHNLIGIADTTSTGFSDGVNGDIVGSLSAPVDPMLGELRFNGGKTQTHALLAGSPAIDKGDNSGAPAFDQRGIRRPRDGNYDGRFIVDIGAFER
jgi:CSLREA domain-containing protein